MFATAIIGSVFVISVIFGSICLSNDIHKYKNNDNSMDDFNAFSGIWQRSIES